MLSGSVANQYFVGSFLVFRPFDQQPLFGSAFLEPFVAMRGAAHAQPCIGAM